jgi:hypothetical protein
VKYFFLADGWDTARVWGFDGLWEESIWRRKPLIERLHLSIKQPQERLWLYRVEDAVVMVEVRPDRELSYTKSNIGQVLLKRLISAEQVLEILSEAEIVMNQKIGNI